jgi:hypothetical protein
MAEQITAWFAANIDLPCVARIVLHEAMVDGAGCYLA